MKAKHQRLITIFAVLAIIAGVALFMGISFKKNIRFFVLPTHVIEENLTSHKNLRLGGVVKEGSFHREDLEASFIVTDGKTDITVHYTGMLPDLFREGQTVVCEGSFTSAEKLQFKAHKVLAKHDENYKPPLLQKDTPA